MYQAARDGSWRQFTCVAWLEMQLGHDLGVSRDGRCILTAIWMHHAAGCIMRREMHLGRNLNVSRGGRRISARIWMHHIGSDATSRRLRCLTSHLMHLG